MPNLGTTLAGATAIALLGYFLYQNFNQPTELKNPEEFLKNAFGEPMDANKFTLEEVKSWVNAQQSNMESDDKVLIMKATQKNLLQLNENLAVGDAENHFMVFAVMTATGTIRKTALVKYKQLDSGLEGALGVDGVLVIEG